MNVTFTLTTLGTAAGPFNISGTTGSNVTTQLASGITADQLASGYTINSVNDAITGGTIASTGSCNTTKTWSATPATPTPTPTVNTPPYNFLVAVGTTGQNNINGSACYNFNSTGGTITLYSYSNAGFFEDGLTYYNSNGSTYNGRGFVYSDGFSYGKVSTLGIFTKIDNCGGLNP
jgi:hypothetical protein